MAFRMLRILKKSSRIRSIGIGEGVDKGALTYYTDFNGYIIANTL